MALQPSSIDPENLFRLVQFFDILAAVVFAVSGSLVASRKEMDVMGFMWFAVITGVGGGTVRDLILGVPVFWVQNPVHVSACLVTAVVMHFVAPRVDSRYRTLLWFDAFGLALVTVAGTVKASDLGTPALVAVAMGAVPGADFRTSVNAAVSAAAQEGKRPDRGGGRPVRLTTPATVRLRADSLDSARRES